MRYREVLHSDLVEEVNSRSDEIRPTANVFDVF